MKAKEKAKELISSFLEFAQSEKGYDFLPHGIFQDLIKAHFDVFGLIDKGLAIDINTLDI